MIKGIGVRSGIELARGSALSSFGLNHKTVQDLQSIIPEMFDYSQDGVYVTANVNNITYPIYNAFNSTQYYADLGAFNEVKSIELTLKSNVSVCAIQIELLENAGAFGVELSFLNKLGTWQGISSYCVGVNGIDDYGNVIVIDGNFFGLNAQVDNSKSMLFVRNHNNASKYKIDFIPYASTNSLLKVKRIVIGNDPLVRYFNEPLDVGFNYDCTIFDATFSTIVGNQCLNFGNNVSSFGYLAYNSTILYNLSRFSICLAFYPRNNSMLNTIVSKGEKLFNVYFDRDNVFLESNGAVAFAGLVDGFFNKWHTLCLIYDGAKLLLIVDGEINISLSVNLDFSDAYNERLIFGCLQLSSGRQNFFNGAIANIEIISTNCDAFYAQQYHNRVVLFG